LNIGERQGYQEMRVAGTFSSLLLLGRGRCLACPKKLNNVYKIFLELVIRNRNEKEWD
jgi:hypothetical protein